MSAITTHVLDTSKGRPAAGVPVALETRDGGTWRRIAHGVTDADGRLRTLMPSEAPLVSGVYRLVFDTAHYFHAEKESAFYPRIVVEFSIMDGQQHYHVPLLLSPFGYTTYRGS